jgi:hypothetical protein
MARSEWLIASTLVKEFPFIYREPDGSLHCSQKPTNDHYHGTHYFSPQLHTLIWSPFEEILLHTHTPSNRSFSYQNSECISHLLVCLKPRLGHSLWSVNRNNICKNVEIIKFLFTQFNPSPYYFLSLKIQTMYLSQDISELRWPLQNTHVIGQPVVVRGGSGSYSA